MNQRKQLLQAMASWITS